VGGVELAGFDEGPAQLFDGGPDGPKTGGSCRQVQPVAATKMITARIPRSPYRRRPPPCGRDGAGGTTRWNNSHNLSRTSHSTIAMPKKYGLK
jgi:hypothetical protein